MIAETISAIKLYSNFSIIDSTDCVLDGRGDILDGAGYFLDGRDDTLDSTGCTLDGRGDTLDSAGCTLNGRGDTLDSTGCTLDGRGVTLDSTGCTLDGRDDTLDSTGYILDGRDDTLDSHTVIANEVWQSTLSLRALAKQSISIFIHGGEGIQNMKISSINYYNWIASAQVPRKDGWKCYNRYSKKNKNKNWRQVWELISYQQM